MAELPCRIDREVGQRNWRAVSDREWVAATIFRSLSNPGPGDRATDVVHSPKGRENFARGSLNGKLTRPSRRDENGLSGIYRKLRLRLRREIGEQKNSDFAFQEINQEFETQRFQLHQASRWADQAQRDKISLYEELELRNGLFPRKSCKGLPRN